MIGATAVAIDDIGPALRRLNDWGQWVVYASAQTSRLAMTTCSASRRWVVIDHSTAADWARTCLSSEHVWLVLDPLFDISGPNTMRLDVSRVASRDGWSLAVELPEAVRQAVDGATVGLLDDAAASGETLMHVAAQVQAAGGTVREFIVMTSSAAARAKIESAYGGGCMGSFIDADAHAIHLRDGCPGLPRAGRRVAGVPPVRIGSKLLEVRVPPAIVRGGLWDRAFSDRSVHQLLMEARKQLLSRFAQALGRPAIVSDIAQLGPDVHVPLCTTVVPEPDMPLERLLLGN